MSEDERQGDTLAVYSDYVCPFCYLGRQSLDDYRASRDAPLSVDWHPFDLRSGQRGSDGEIDDSIDDGKDDAFFERVQESVDRLCEENGVSEMLDLADVPDVDSLNAQVASAHVQSAFPTAWDDFDRATFDALWVEGRDVGDPDVLAAVAEAVGLDGDEIRQAVADDDRREQVFEAFAAANRRGITGVPTFVHDGAVVRGAVPPEHLRRLVEGPG